MDIKTFKRHAKLTEDNRKNASHNWSKSWGFDFWYNLWAYRTYELGRFKYKSGTVTMRHYSYQHKEYYIDGKSVTEYKFKKQLANEPEPPYIPTEPIPETVQRTRKRLTDKSKQLELEL